VIAEAMAADLPVICIDRGGPPTLAGGGVPVGTVGQTVRALAEAVERTSVDGAAAASPPLFEEATGRLATLLAERVGLETPDAAEPQGRPA
jgi:glycosyltransferase involved in cell wall biosynthesis